MSLIGPDKIRVSEVELEELRQTYQTLKHDMNALIDDFYTPFEVMQLIGALQGDTASSFNSFCTITRSYLETRYDTTFDDLTMTLNRLQEELQETKI